MIDWKNKSVIKECKRLKLAKYAAVDAAACTPKGNEASQTELEVDAFAHEHLSEITQIGLKYFGKLEPEINKLKQKIINAKQSFKKTSQKYQNEVSQATDKAHLNIENQKNTFNVLKDNFDLFKAQNYIARPAAPADLFKFIIFIGIIAILYFVEVGVNSEIAGQAFDGGRAEGETISKAVAGLNVFLSFLIGFYAVKQIFHSHPGNKIAGKIILFLYVPFVTYVNFSFGALRALASTYSVDTSDGVDIDNLVDNETSVDNIAGNPELGAMFDNIPSTFEEMKSLSLTPWKVDQIPWDYESFVLVAIGLAFGIFSILDGYMFDDKYPGYGSAARKKDNAKKKILKSYEVLSSQINKISNDFNAELDDKKSVLGDSIDKWSLKTNEFENEIHGYRTSLESGRKAYSHMNRQYMILNQKTRPNKCKETPERFKIAEDPEAKCYKYDKNTSDPKIIFKQHYDVYMEDGERVKKAQDYHHNINTIFIDEKKEMISFDEIQRTKLREEHGKLKEIF